MYKIGTKVVYKGHGIGTIKRIETKSVGDKHKQFYLLSIDHNNMFILAPIDSDCLRPIASKVTAKLVLKFLASQNTVKPSNETWNRRYRNNMECLKTGDLLNIAKVYKELQGYKAIKELSFGERKMLEWSKELLLCELGLALGLDSLGILFEINRLGMAG